jgi:hypothetical protein
MQLRSSGDVVGKLNIRKKALKMLGIKINPGEFWPPNSPQMTDVNLNRWGNL